MSDINPVDSLPISIPYAYCHDFEKKLTSTIPDSIIITIQSFVRELKIFGKGGNRYRILGNTDETDTSHIQNWCRLKEYEEILPHPNALFISMQSVFIVTSDNKLYARGFNKYSRLGIKTSSADKEIKYLKNFEPIKALNDKPYASTTPIIICEGEPEGYNFIYHNNTLYLARDKTQEKESSLMECNQFWGKSSIRCITSDGSITYFLTADNKVYNDQCEQLYKGISKIVCGEYFALMLTMDNKVIIEDCTGTSVMTRNCDISMFEEKGLLFRDVSGGQAHAAAITMDDKVYLWGNNEHGKCGVDCGGEYGPGYNEWVKTPNLLVFEDGDERVEQVGCGCEHTILLTKSNNIYGLGQNCYNHNMLVWSNFVKHGYYGGIWKPYLLDKEKEFGIDKSEWISAIYAINRNATIVIVDPFMRVPNYDKN